MNNYCEEPIQGVNVCDGCKVEILPGENVFLTVLTEINASSSPHLPTYDELSMGQTIEDKTDDIGQANRVYPFRTFCTVQCVVDYYTN